MLDVIIRSREEITGDGWAAIWRTVRCASPPPHLVILAAAPLGLLIPPSRRSHPSQPSRSPRHSSLCTQPWGADVCISRSATGHSRLVLAFFAVYTNARDEQRAQPLHLAHQHTLTLARAGRSIIPSHRPLAAAVARCISALP